ncbi:MAG TPA: hypothetical protein VJT11_09165 [Nitrospiraceae bacterium]|nr:hypothetical protein [Nitrospiraceae bacterium]
MKMNWMRAITGLCVLWSSTAAGAMLTWNANTEPDLAGYRIYQCSILPCTKSSGTLLTTLGRTTSFNIGTPATIQYYFVTAHDQANNESGISSVATFRPAGSPPPPPPMGTVRLTMVGNPATSAWGVTGTVADSRDVMADVYHDGRLIRTEHSAPYCNFAETSNACGTGSLGTGQHTVQFVFKLEGTATEIGRASMTVQEGNSSPPPPPPAPAGPVSLTIVGDPATSRWGVGGTVTDSRDVMADVYHDGRLIRTEHNPPYCNFSETLGACGTGSLGTGPHMVQFVFKLEGTATEIGRESVTVQEGNPSPPPSPEPPVGPVSLTIVGNPATSRWGVAGTVADSRNVMADVYHDGRIIRTEHSPPYCNFAEMSGACGTGSLGAGPHTVQFVFKLEGTATEIGRASVTVQEE